ncbi:Bacterial Ig domain protein [compost metagenome]
MKSSAGGSDTEPVSVVGFSAPQAQNKAPLAAADSASTRYDTPVSINVLDNDSDPDNDVPLAIADFTQPAAGQGTVVAQGTALLYTPPAVVSAPLNATFTYRAKDTKGLASLPATVIVNVTPKPNLPPKASNDLGSVQVGSLTLKVLDNDSDPEGGSLSVANLTQPASGQGSVSTNGTTVTYNPPALVLFPFTATFTYQARDNVGNLSAPATVSVQVSLLSTLESLSVGTAQATARAGGRYDWTFSGNSSVILGNTITVYVNTPNGVVPLGNASVSLLLGRWSLTVNNSTIAPSSPPTAAVRSSLGTVRNVTVNVR